MRPGLARLGPSEEVGCRKYMLTVLLSFTSLSRLGAHLRHDQNITPSFCDISRPHQTAVNNKCFQLSLGERGHLVIDYGTCETHERSVHHNCRNLFASRR